MGWADLIFFGGGNWAFTARSRSKSRVTDIQASHRLLGQACISVSILVLERWYLDDHVYSARLAELCSQTSETMTIEGRAQSFRTAHDDLENPPCLVE
jgi:hypothetical protein